VWGSRGVNAHEKRVSWRAPLLPRRSNFTVTNLTPKSIAFWRVRLLLALQIQRRKNIQKKQPKPQKEFRMDSSSDGLPLLNPSASLVFLWLFLLR
jgi:hypothetical protein